MSICVTNQILYYIIVSNMNLVFILGFSFFISYKMMIIFKFLGIFIYYINKIYLIYDIFQVIFKFFNSQVLVIT